MALYHLHVKNISRGDGRSAVACAAYRAGETLPNEAEEKASAFGGRRDVVLAEIRAPAGAPDWMQDRAALWNAAERAEKRKDSRLAKEIEFSLPRELARSQWLPLARQMADTYTSLGYVVDLAIHDDGTAHNPHVHLMLTTRLVTPDGFGGKLRDADGKMFVRDARAAWARIANAALGAAGFAAIDPRSHAARGLDQIPGEHHAPDREARRQRRKERSAMSLQQDVIAARNEMVAMDDIRTRYPQLSARPDWPPEQRHVDNYLPPEVKAEHDRFWREVHRRALEPERIRDDGDERSPVAAPERAAFARDIEGLADSAAVAAAREDILDRIMAVDDARDLYAAIRDRMVTEMVRAGLMDPRTAEHVRMIEQKLYPDEFSRMQAEAQRNEARRYQVGQMPTPTPAMLRQAAAMDQAEEDRAFEAYEAARVSPPAVPSPAAERGWLRELLNRTADNPVPDPDGRLIPEIELVQAERRMLDEVERPSREVPEPPPVERAPEVEREAAEQAVERLNAIEVPEIEAEGYRLAPQENRLDWLEAQPRQAERVVELAPEVTRSDDRLDWLRPLPKQPVPERDEREEGPDRYQR